MTQSDHEHRGSGKLLNDEQCIRMHDGKVTMPRWMASLGVHMLVLLLGGAFSTFVIVVVWIALLTGSTRQVIENQENVKKTLEKGQKTILRRIDRVSPDSKSASPDSDPPDEG